MSRYQIWDHWDKLGEVDAYNPDHALRLFRKERGYAWTKLFVYHSA